MFHIGLTIFNVNFNVRLTNEKAMEYSYICHRIWTLNFINTKEQAMIL